MSSIVIARFFPKQGSEACVESTLREMVVHTRNEPGCRRYDLYQSSPASAEKTFALIEQYADQAAIQAHRETPHYKAYRANIMDLLARPIDVTILDPLDVLVPLSSLSVRNTSVGSGTACPSTNKRQSDQKVNLTPTL